MTTLTVQPKDSDLDAIAALATSAFGRSLLAAANFGAYAALVASGTPSDSTFLRGDGTWSGVPQVSSGVDSVNGQSGTVNLDADDVGAQPSDSDLTAIAALTTTVFGRGFLSLADAAAARTHIDAQQADADLTAIAALSSAADKLPYSTGAQTWALADFTAFGRSLVDDANGGAALTTLGVSAFAQTILDDADAATVRTTIGAQQSDTELTAIAGLTSAADKGIYFTGSGTASTFDLGSFARGLLALTTSSAVRSYLGLVIGTDVQPLDADLTAIAALTTTSYGRGFLTLADAAAGRTALALGTAATVNTGTTSGTIPTLGASGTFAVARLATGTPDGTKFVRDDGTLAVPPGGSGGEVVTTAAVWDAKGDLAVGTGADAADNLTVGANDTLLMADSAANAMGLKWATPSVVRTALGLVIGTNVQAYDADLAALAGVTSSADTLPYFTGSATATTTTLTAFARTILDDADAATVRSTLGLVLGIDVQPYDADLANIASSSTTSYGRSFLTLADATAGRSHLSLGTLATLSAVSSSNITADQGITGGTSGHLGIGTITNANLASAAAIAHSKLATMSTGTLLGNSSGSTAAPSAQSMSTVRTMLGSGTPSSSTFLRGDGTWEVPPKTYTSRITARGAFR